MNIIKLMPALLALFGSLFGSFVALYANKNKFKNELKTRFMDQLNRELFDLCGDFIVDLSVDEIDNIPAVGLNEEYLYKIDSLGSFTKLVLFLTRHKDVYGLEFKKEIDALNHAYVKIKIGDSFKSESFALLKKTSKSVELIKHKIFYKLK